MGCVVVPSIAQGLGGTRSEVTSSASPLCTTNSSLFGAHRSDCHAEANAVAVCALRGEQMRGSSCYVTRAPCVACYKLLASAGVARIVAPQALPSADCAASAGQLGIELCVLPDSEARAAWREALGSANEDMDRVRRLREERKRLRKEGSFGRKAIGHAAGQPGGGGARAEE